MGWSPELWAAQSPPTYTCLIDEAHVVAERYGMTNVPQSVWIDENGRLVRPAESAGCIDLVRQLNRETFEIPEAAAKSGAEARSAYIDALRDWVERGDASPYALSGDEVKRRLRGPSVRRAGRRRVGRRPVAKTHKTKGPPLVASRRRPSPS